MAGTSARQRAKDNSHSSRSAEQRIESPKEMSQDFVEFLTDYAQKKPGYAALWCIGIGFVLGWKLKPW